MSASLPNLAVNIGRMQRRDDATPAVETCAYRVVIDVLENGGFVVHSDPDVEVICRCAHLPEDELVRVGRRPIPDAWLEGPVGNIGDGSVDDLLAEVITTWEDPT